MTHWISTHFTRAALAKPALQRDIRVVSVLGAIWLVIMACGGQTVNPATGYTCGEGNASCNAQDWTQNSEYRGYKIDVTTEHLSCTADCYAGGVNGRVNNTVTLLDTGANGFIRIGYQTHNVGGTNTQIWYFWDQNRPGLGYQVNWQGQVPSNAIGQWAEYDVHATGPGNYSVSLNQTLSGGGSSGFSGSSTSNSMSPNQIVFGQQLIGHAGAAADVAFFQHMQWYDSGSGLHNITDYGSWHEDAPPYGRWIIDPHAVSNPPTVYDNDFYTECCLPPSLDISLG